MANTVFKLRRSSVAGKIPTTSDIAIGELAVNLTDRKLYSSDGSNVWEIGSNVTSINVGSVYANGSFGTAGQVLHSNGSAAYWATDDQGVTSVATGDGLTGGIITNTGTVSVLANSGIIANSSGVFVDTAYIATLSANNTTYVNGKTESNLNVNSALSSNNSSYLGGTAAAGYQTTAGLASNVATLAANSATYLGNSSGTIANVSSWITGNAATAYSNSVSYVDGKILTANSAITGNAATAYSNAVSYTDSKIATANSAITGNAATSYSNAVSYTDSKIATANSAITGNAATAYSNAVAYVDGKSYVNTSQLSSNLANYQTTAGLSANVATLTSNNTTYVNGKTEANLNVNSAVYATNAVNANNADYLDGQHGSYYTNATNISTGTLAEARLPYRMNQNVTTSNDVTFGSLTLTGNLTVSGNVTVIGANNLSVVDNMIYLNSNNTVDNEDIGIVGNYNTTGNSLGYAHTGIFRDASDGYWKVFDGYKPEPDANVNIDTTNTSFQLANFQANLYAAGNTSTNWFIANTSGAYHTGTVNAASHTVGAAFTANSTMTNTVSLVVSTNTATIGTGSYFVSNGNVGIGTATPAGKLDVYGGYLYVRSQGGTSAIEIGAGQTSNQYAVIDLVGDTTYADYGLRIIRGNAGPNTDSSIENRGTGILRLNTPDSGGSIALRTNAVDRFTVASNGNVGIGNSAPTEKLQIQGNIQLQNGASAANTSRNAGIRFWTDNAFGAELHYGDTASGLSSGYATAIYGRKIDTVAVRIGAYPVSNTSQNTFSEYITVLNNGNVGIGNSSPAHLFSVNGGALVNTHVSVGNSTINAVVNSTSLYFNSTTSAALVISKPASNSSLNYRFDVGPVGGNNAVQSGPFWNGWNFAAPVITLANSSLTYPRTSFYYSYTNTTAPTDMYFNIAAGNDSGLGTGIKLYATGTDTVNRGIDIAANGNVGINTSTPGYNLEVYNASAATDYYLARFISSAAVSGTSTSHIRIEKGNGYGGTIGGYITQGVGSGLVLGTLNGGTQSNTMWITNGGNVGIGTTSPGTKLDVAGAVRATSSTQYQGYFLLNSSYTVAKIYGQSASNDGGSLELLSAGTPNIVFTAGGGDNYINNGGNLGIGTNSPSEKLHVVGRALIRGATAGTAATLATETSALSLINGTSYNATPSVSFTIGSSNWDAVNNNTAFQWLFTTPSTSGGASLAISSRSFNGTSTYTTTERVRIDASGNVGVGTSSPGGKLAVRHDITAYGQVWSGYNGATFQNDCVLGFNGQTYFGNFQANPLTFITNNVERMRIDASGNVLPGADNTYNLGSITMRWANIFTGDLHLSNENSNGNDIDKTTGNWTIQEGETDLYIINNKNGKKFKFKLEEIQ